MSFSRPSDKLEKTCVQHMRKKSLQPPNEQLEQMILRNQYPLPEHNLCYNRALMRITSLTSSFLFFHNHFTMITSAKESAIASLMFFGSVVLTVSENIHISRSVASSRLVCTGLGWDCHEFELTVIFVHRYSESGERIGKFACLSCFLSMNSVGVDGSDEVEYALKEVCLFE
ncbi:hypothetical protein Tco_0169328 [Tanacetum coccineum]